VHLLSPEELKARSMKNAKAQLVIGAYPMMALKNEALEGISEQYRAPT
jgi:hypothetical protein